MRIHFLFQFLKTSILLVLAFLSIPIVSIPLASPAQADDLLIETDRGSGELITESSVSSGSTSAPEDENPNSNVNANGDVTENANDPSYSTRVTSSFESETDSTSL